MNGTEWTEPGQGATVRQLMNTLGDKYRYQGTGFHPAMGRMYRILNDAFGPLPERRTNLRLTGSPLTAADLARIAGAK